MSLHAQRDYYQLSSAAKVLQDRLTALRDSVPLGSTLLDIGCNDGSVSNGLIESGHASHSYCYDLEDIVAYKQPQITFRPIDLFSVDLDTLPSADGVLLLNIMHHIVGRSVERAREIINSLLDRYPFLIIDLGSCSEQGDWGWRRTYSKYWASDTELWDDLFQQAEWRFKLLRYPTQGGGHRVLWKLYKSKYELSGLETVSSYLRSPGAWPKDKRLFDSIELVPENTKLVTSVVFERSVSSRRDYFWTKRYLGNDGILRAQLEFDLAEHAKQITKQIKPTGQMRFKNLRVCRPVAVKGSADLQFLYEPDLASADVVHLQDWAKFYSSDEVYEISCFSVRQINFQKLGSIQISNISDFQAARTWDGITLLDFEPNPWVLKALPLLG